MSTPASLPSAPECVTLLEHAAVLPAIADPMRHALLCALADGQPQSVNDLAARFNRSPDGISKHLRVLRQARLIRAVTPPGSDGRKQFHELPALFRSRDHEGKIVLDFGTVLVRVA
jgi:DNA-binding transcriptional ArsR family regulator